MLEGRFPPKSIIPVDVDPVTAPGQFRFDRVVT
jgi:ATP-dependent Clp protease ATP-binding subunit ClpB